MNQANIQFESNVILIDTYWIESTIPGIIEYLARQLGQQIPSVDFIQWLQYLALDGGIRDTDNKVQIILIRPQEQGSIPCLEPTDLKDIDGKACRTALGEFCFYCVSPEGITDNEHLFIDLMTLAIDDSHVERLLLLPHDAIYGSQIDNVLDKIANEQPIAPLGKLIRFDMQNPQTENPVSYKRDFIGYSLMQAMKIKAE